MPAKSPTVIEVQGQAIRLDGIYSAAPETADYLQAHLVAHMAVDNLGTDRHRTIIANVTSNGINLQQQAVGDGMALAYPFAKDEVNYV